MRPLFLFTRTPALESEWPFVPERMVARLSELGEVRVLNATKEPLHQQADLGEVWGLIWFGGAFTPECVAAAPRLRAVGGITDNAGYGLPVQRLSRRFQHVNLAELAQPRRHALRHERPLRFKRRMTGEQE